MNYTETQINWYSSRDCLKTFNKKNKMKELEVTVLVALKVMKNFWPIFVMFAVLLIKELLSGKKD